MDWFLQMKSMSLRCKAKASMAILSIENSLHLFLYSTKTFLVPSLYQALF